MIQEDGGRVVKAHCGNLPPDATESDIRRKWGAGRYALQLRVGQRTVIGRTLVIDGPEQSQLPFGPLQEMPSGLLSLVQADPLTAAIFAMHQVQLAQTREDSQRMLQMVGGFVDKLATQYGSQNINAQLRETIKEQNARIKELEAARESIRDKEHAIELEKVKLKYKDKNGTDWVEVVKGVGEALPEIAKFVPPGVQKFLESLVAGELPPGAVESPAVKG